MYHSVIYTNKQVRELLASAGIAPEDFTIAIVKGKPARTKNKIVVNDKQVTLFCNDCVAKGYIKR